jgi:hypothetical protein
MHSRELVVGIPQKTTNSIRNTHLIKPSKVQSLIHSFLDTLKWDIQTPLQNLVAHEVSLEYLYFDRIILILIYHEVSTTYIRDKEKGKS